MKLSVIIPYYNADKWIGRMLDSLLKQDLSAEEYEVLVIDDGSVHEPKILKEYAAIYTNIRYIRQENSGPGGARNTGIKNAQGDYVFFCDSDDYIAENVLKSLYEIAHSRKVDMLFHQIRRIPENEKPLNPRRNFDHVNIYSSGKEYFALPFKDKITTGVWQFIISRKFIERVHLSFPSDMIMNEDSCFWIDAILSAGIVASVDVEVYFYVQNPQSLIHLSGRVKQTERYADNMIIFVRKLTDILTEKKAINDMPKGCVNNIKWVRNQKAFIMLVAACHYLPEDKLYGYVSELKSLHAYPHAFGRYKFLKCFFLNPICMRILNKWYNRKNQ